MRANIVPIPRFGARRRAMMSARPLLGAAVLTLGVGMALPAAADAREEEPKAPEYSLSIVEGESTAPEESVLSTSGSIALPHTKDVPVTVRIAEPDGLTVAQNTHDGGVWLSQVPQVEDYVYLESPAGTPLESVKYDGLPSLDPTVCAGSTNFSGQRTEGEEVEGTADTYVVHPSYTAKRFDGAAQITSLSGSSFGGDFLKPLELGETVSVREHLATALGGGGSFTYSSEDVRPVGACPAPPPPPPPPPPPALAGSLFKLFGSNLHKLLKSGLSDQVTINQAGTVTQDLYEEDGSVPATASTHGKHGAKHKRRKPPALLLARGTVSATTAGTVTVHLRVTAKGRHALSHSHRVRAMLVTTLKTGSGTKLNLPTRSVTLDR